MRFTVRLTDGVLDDIATLYEWIVREGAPVTARRWTQGLMRALASLETFPRRYPIAREAELFEQVVVRQMIHGSIRVLYVVREAEVVVLHARHASRQDLGAEDLADWPDDVREGEVAQAYEAVLRVADAREDSGDMATKKQTKSFTVTLPEELRAFVEEQVCANNLPSASAYVEVLVAREKASLESHLVRAIRRGGRVVADAAFWRRKERRLSAAIDGPRR